MSRSQYVSVTGLNRFMASLYRCLNVVAVGLHVDKPEIKIAVTVCLPSSPIRRPTSGLYNLYSDIEESIVAGAATACLQHRHTTVFFEKREPRADDVEIEFSGYFRS